MSLVTDHSNTTNSSNEPIPAKRVWEMLSGIDIAMLVTRADTGLHGRPMSTIPRPEKGVIYILTESGSSAAREIGAESAVLLSYQGRGDHLAVQGSARVDPDRTLVNELWNPGAEVFWPNGPEAHDVVALVIDPGHVEVWDGPGVLRGIASILKSRLTGHTPDMGTHGPAEL